MHFKGTFWRAGALTLAVSAPAFAQMPGGMFWRQQDVTPPPVLTGFTAATGASPGQITLTLDFPVVVTDYARVDVRRLAGATAPNVDCASDGVVAKTFVVGQFIDGNSVDTGLTAGSFYSYRACIYDAANNKTATQTDVNNQAKPAPANHRIFVTNTSYTGNLGGLSGADTACQTSATAAAIGGTWKAVLSTSIRHARDRFLNPYGAIYDLRPAGSGGPQQIATSIADLFDGSIALDIQYGEDGSGPNYSTLTWSGSAMNGTYDGATCLDWTSAASGNTGIAGMPEISGTSYWLNYSTDACNLTHSLICIDGQDSSNPLALDYFHAEPYVGSAGQIKVTVDFPSDTTSYQQVDIRRLAGATPPNSNCGSDGTVVKTYTVGQFTDGTYIDTGLTQASIHSYRACITSTNASLTSFQTVASVKARSTTIHRAFVTSTLYAGNLGDAGANTKCQTRASVPGYGGSTWKAIISTAALNAKDRLTISGNVFNMRAGAGMAQSIADNATDFWQTTLDGDWLIYSEFGVKVPFPEYTYTGSTTAGLTAASHCSSWITASSGIQAILGRASFGDSMWLSGNNSFCDQTWRLYCLEQ